MKTVKAVASENVNGRYVITDRGTKAIIDDNQGYGFKTPQKAYKAHWWKTTQCKKQAVSVGV